MRVSKGGQQRYCGPPFETRPAGPLLRVRWFLDLGLDQILDLVVGREAAGLAAGVFERAVDGDVELAGSAGAQLDVRRAQLLEAIPHTEGLRLVTSGAAIFDQDFHAMKMGR